MKIINSKGFRIFIDLMVLIALVGIIYGVISGAEPLQILVASLNFLSISISRQVFRGWK